MKKKVMVEGKEIEIDIDDPSLVDEIVKLQKSNEDLRNFINDRLPKIEPPKVPDTPAEQKTLIEKFFQWLQEEGK
jgi:hypothetical protein